MFSGRIGMVLFQKLNSYTHYPHACPEDFFTLPNCPIVSIDFGWQLYQEDWQHCATLMSIDINLAATF
jgi:hypothetical protein